MTNYDRLVKRLLESHDSDKEKDEEGIDKDKADVNKDGKLEPWELARAKAIEKNKAKAENKK